MHGNGNDLDDDTLGADFEAALAEAEAAALQRRTTSGQAAVHSAPSGTHGGDAVLIDLEDLDQFHLNTRPWVPQATEDPRVPKQQQEPAGREIGQPEHGKGRSLLSLKGHRLSVTDITACEWAAGSEVHNAMELDVLGPSVEVAVESREDGRAVRLLNMATQIRQLLSEGMTRELWVFSPLPTTPPARSSTVLGGPFDDQAESSTACRGPQLAHTVYCALSPPTAPGAATLGAAAAEPAAPAAAARAPAAPASDPDVIELDSDSDAAAGGAGDDTPTAWLSGIIDQLVISRVEADGAGPSPQETGSRQDLLLEDSLRPSEVVQFIELKTRKQPNKGTVAQRRTARLQVLLYHYMWEHMRRLTMSELKQFMLQPSRNEPLSGMGRCNPLDLDTLLGSALQRECSAVFPHAMLDSAGPPVPFPSCSITNRVDPGSGDAKQNAGGSWTLALVLRELHSLLSFLPPAALGYTHPSGLVFPPHLVRYVWQQGSKPAPGVEPPVLHEEVVSYEAGGRQWMESQLADHMGFWQGLLPPSAVPDDEMFKCRYCNFRDNCIRYQQAEGEDGQPKKKICVSPPW